MMRGLLIFGLCAVALAPTGCGSLGGDETKPKSRTPVVSREQLGGFPERSPGRAFLGWFRALQQRNSAAAARYYRSSLGLTPEEFAIQRRRASYAVDSLGPPRIVRVVEQGARAVVYAALRKVTIAPNGRVDKEDLDTHPFGLLRERGGWKLANNRFLEIVSRTPSNDGTEPASRKRVVSRKELDRFPGGGPARAFLGWFRALQQLNSIAAARYYSASLGMTPEELARQRRRAAYALDSFASPRIARIVQNGSRATVYVVFRKTIVAPNGRVEVKEVERATPFVLLRERGGWKHADNGFLEILSRTPSS
jgi:hypothetical protein